jgi:hypothetical protein
MSQERQILESWAKQNPGLFSGLKQAISGAEGTILGGRPGYNVMFGGGRFKDFSRHPDRVISSPGGYSSAAAGAYQFMPGTWSGVQKSLGLPDFSPQSQDIGMLKKVRERLMPLGGLSAISKAGTDLVGRYYAEAYNMVIMTTRMFTHTGPRRGDVFAESTFAKQIAMIEGGRIDPIVRVGNLDSMRTWADVRDAVNLLQFSAVSVRKHCRKGGQKSSSTLWTYLSLVREYLEIDQAPETVFNRLAVIVALVATNDSPEENSESAEHILGMVQAIRYGKGEHNSEPLTQRFDRFWSEALMAASNNFLDWVALGLLTDED